VRADPTDERPSKGVRFLSLVAALEGTDEEGALELLGFSENIEIHTENVRRFQTATSSAPEFVDVPLPDEYEPVFDGQRYRMPKYLTTRGISRETARSFQLGFCQTGKFAGRIIIPVSCPKGRSFQARATWDTPLRYLSGPGSGKLLHGWYQARELIDGGDARIESAVVVVEGPFDAMRLHQFGFPAVALMGLAVRRAQKDMLLLEELSGMRYVIMLDTTAVDAALAAGQRLGTERVLIAFLRKAKDPAEASEEAIEDALRNAVPWHEAMARASVIRAGLGI
jgi:DNA primase